MSTLYEILYEIDDITDRPLEIEIDGLKMNLTDYMNHDLCEEDDSDLNEWEYVGDLKSGFSVIRVQTNGFSILPSTLRVNLIEEAA